MSKTKIDFSPISNYSGQILSRYTSSVNPSARKTTSEVLRSLNSAPFCKRSPYFLALILSADRGEAFTTSPLFPAPSAEPLEINYQSTEMIFGILEVEFVFPTENEKGNRHLILLHLRIYTC